MSWYPLGHGDKTLINEDVFAELGSKYNKTSAQIILKWHIQMGFIVIPGASKEEHIKQNIAIFDFELTAEDMKKIAQINKNKRYYIRTDEQLINFASWMPNLDNQK